MTAMAGLYSRRRKKSTGIAGFRRTARRWQKFLAQLLKETDRDGYRVADYARKPREVPGRFYSNGLQGMPQWLRVAVGCADHYSDLDLSNAFPALLWEELRKLDLSEGSELEPFRRCVFEREEVLKELKGAGMDRTKAKVRLHSVLHGARTVEGDPPFVKDFGAAVEELTSRLRESSKFAPVWKAAEEKHGTFVARVAHHLEAEAASALLEECAALGVVVGASTFDGLLVETASIGAAGFSSEKNLMDHLNLSLERKLGFARGVVKLTDKEFDDFPQMDEMLSGRVKPEEVFAPAHRRVDLAVPFSSKGAVRAAGASFEWGAKRWFLPRGGNLLPIRKLVAEGTIGVHAEAPVESLTTEVVVRHSGKEEDRELMKAYGAKWQADQYKWVVHPGCDLAPLRRMASAGRISFVTPLKDPPHGPRDDLADLLAEALPLDGDEPIPESDGKGWSTASSSSGGSPCRSQREAASPPRRPALRKGVAAKMGYDRESSSEDELVTTPRSRLKGKWKRTTPTPSPTYVRGPCFVCFTDGSARGNGTSGARGGCGVFVVDREGA